MAHEGINESNNVIQFAGERDPNAAHQELWEVLKRADVLLGDVEQRIPRASDDEMKARLEGWHKELQAATKTVSESMHIVTPATTVQQLQAKAQPLDTLTKRIRLQLYPEEIPPFEMRVRPKRPRV